VTLDLDDPDLRECFEGVIPSTVATCALDGTPNITYISQTHYVDAGHVALSYQFFNKTRQNILANPRATVGVLNPVTGSRYRLDVEYLRTETAGPLFESMKAKLAGIASHTGMSGVFRLLGSDVYRVLAVERVSAGDLGAARDSRPLLQALRPVAARIARSLDLSSLLDDVLEGLDTQLGSVTRWSSCWIPEAAASTPSPAAAMRSRALGRKSPSAAASSAWPPSSARRSGFRT